MTSRKDGVYDTVYGLRGPVITALRARAGLLIPKTRCCSVTSALPDCPVYSRTSGRTRRSICPPLQVLQGLPRRAIIPELAEISPAWNDRLAIQADRRAHSQYRSRERALGFRNPLEGLRGRFYIRSCKLGVERITGGRDFNTPLRRRL